MNAQEADNPTIIDFGKQISQAYELAGQIGEQNQLHAELLESGQLTVPELRDLATAHLIEMQHDTFGRLVEVSEAMPTQEIIARQKEIILAIEETENQIAQLAAEIKREVATIDSEKALLASRFPELAAQLKELEVKPVVQSMNAQTMHELQARRQQLAAEYDHYFEMMAKPWPVPQMISPAAILAFKTRLKPVAPDEPKEKPHSTTLDTSSSIIETKEPDTNPSPAEDIDAKIELRVAKLESASFGATDAQTLTQVLRFLAQFEERQPLKEISSKVYGRARLPKTDEADLLRLLDRATEAGFLRRYGRTFGYVSEEDESVLTEHRDDTVTELDPLEDKADQDLYAFVLEHAQNGEVHIGEIVRSHFKEKKLSPRRHQDLIAHLNRMADAGYLLHAGGSPWYGVANIRIREVAAETAQPISTQAPQGTAETAEPSTFAVELENATAELNTLEASILEYARGRGFFRTEEMHRELPEVNNLSEEEYASFKKEFATIRQKIIEYLKAAGKTAYWRETGRARGTKYLLFIEDEPQKPIAPEAPIPSTRAVKDAKSTESIGSSPTARSREQSSSPPPIPRRAILRRREVQQPRGESEQPELSEATKRRVKAAVDATIRAGKGEEERLSVLIRQVAKAEGVEPGHVRDVVGQLVSAGTYHFDSKAGVRKVTSRPPNRPARPSHRATNEATNGKESDPKAWTTEDVTWTRDVLQKLLTFSHWQQGLEPKDLIRELGIGSDKEQLFRQALRKMEAAGVVRITKNANLNSGSPHSKKIRGSRVHLPSQASKARAKADLSGIIEELQQRIES